jgi:hypothetical protein
MTLLERWRVSLVISVHARLYTVQDWACQPPVAVTSVKLGEHCIMFCNWWF